MGKLLVKSVEVNNRGRVIRQFKDTLAAGHDIYLTLISSSSSILKRCWQAVARR